MGAMTGPFPSRTHAIVSSARIQAHDLLTKGRASILLSRRRQLGLAITCGVLAGVTCLVALSTHEPGHALASCPATDPVRLHPVIPEEWRVVALPRDVISPNVEPGDTVDVVSQSHVIAGGALVVSSPTESDGASVAVPSDTAATVATAAQNGDISMVAMGNALP